MFCINNIVVMLVCRKGMGSNWYHMTANKTCILVTSNRECTQGFIHQYTDKTGQHSNKHSHNDKYKQHQSLILGKSILSRHTSPKLHNVWGMYKRAHVKNAMPGSQSSSLSSATKRFIYMCAYICYMCTHIYPYIYIYICIKHMYM